MVTRAAPVSYWPIFFLVPNNNPRSLCKKNLGPVSLYHTGKLKVVSKFQKHRATERLALYISLFINLKHLLLDMTTGEKIAGILVYRLQPNKRKTNYLKLASFSM